MNTVSMLARARLCNGLALTLADCMSSVPVYDKHFDEAAHTIHVMQTLNPNVSMNSDSVGGVNGRAATSTMDHYNTQYRVPQSGVSASTVGVSSDSSLDSMDK